MSLELTSDEISGVIRVVGEVCDRWDDPRAWREHLLRGACGLLGGNVGTILTEEDGKPGQFGKLVVNSIVGVPAAQRALVEPAFSQLDRRDYEDVSQHVMPGLTVLYGQIVRQGWATASRDQVTDAASYHRAPYYLGFRRQIDCDDYVVSIRIVDLPRRPEAISVDRPHGAPPFGSREVAILKLLHDQVAPLVGVRLATEAHFCRDGLSKRLRETLSLLLEGHGEKQVGRILGLSPRTVHDYVTMLYAHFEVSSRAELLAYFIRRAPIRRHPRRPAGDGGGDGIDNLAIRRVTASRRGRP
jgi:DNA-binding CsgD family transcriptional regulator